ncbi:MAG: YraN family protein [Phycisphaeraceae bacterium]|nr:YraN family protein [Phycisphaeraceae bacterium]
MRLPSLLRQFLGQDRSPGEQGEHLAEKHLKKQGYKTVARNLRSRFGEIDLLVLGPDKRTLVFVEVKTARADRQSSVPPEHRVGPQKQRKIAALAARLIAKHKLTGRPIRFDVVGVDLHDDRDADVRHYVGAFESPW